MRQVALVLVTVVLAVAGAGEAGKPADRPQLPVVGTSQPLELVPNLLDVVESGSGRLWSHSLRVPDATFLKPHFVDVNLRAGDAIVVRSRSGHVVEVIEGRGPKEVGTFWGLSAMGDELLLELAFQHDYPAPPFRVDQVIVGSAELFDGGAPGGPESICPPEDFDDVICYQGDAGTWANVVASVGVMTVGGTPATGLWCSGANVSPRNYLLTNQHCIENQAGCASSEFVFKYYRTGCNDGSAATADWQGFHCDTVVASSPYGGLCEPNPSNLDFTLSSVVGDPAATYGNVQPDPTPLTSGEAVYIVQHPDGRPHEITHGSGADVVVDGYTVRYYNTLDTEPGSSGSPIFRQADHRMVGLHHCGDCATAGQGNRGMRMSDIYPHIESYLCTTEVTLAGDGSQDLQEVAGNGDAVVDPGETWSFRPRVRNQACELGVRAVHGDVEVNVASAGPLQVSPAAVQFGAIAAGTAAASVEAVVVALDPQVACGGEVMVDLANVTGNGVAVMVDVRPIWTAPVGELVTTVLLSEDFADGLTGWTVVDGGTGSGPAQTWTTSNPGGRTLPLTAPFAIADSDDLGSGLQMDEELISPVVDCTGYAQVELQLAHDFNSYSDELADVDVRSAATGGAWVNVARFTGADASGTVLVDISAQASGQVDVQVRFHYHNAVYEYWWAVDDVTILGNNGFVCNPYENAAIFADGFESGDVGAWDSSQP